MKNIAMLPVRCISIRESNPTQITVGHGYVVDRLSIVYDCKGNRLGNMLLKHFSCL